MTDTNTNTSIIYVFLATTILGGLLSVGTALYFSLRCMRARGDIPPEPAPLHEVVIISPAAAQQQAPQRQPLLVAQRPLLQPLQLA